MTSSAHDPAPPPDPGVPPELAFGTRAPLQLRLYRDGDHRAIGDPDRGRDIPDVLVPCFMMDGPPAGKIVPVPSDWILGGGYSVTGCPPGSCAVADPAAGVPAAAPSDHARFTYTRRGRVDILCTLLAGTRWATGVGARICILSSGPESLCLHQLRRRGVDWTHGNPLLAQDRPMYSGPPGYVSRRDVLPDVELDIARALGADFRRSLGPNADAMSPNVMHSMLQSFARLVWRGSAMAWRPCRPGERPHVHTSPDCPMCMEGDGDPTLEATGASGSPGASFRTPPAAGGVLDTYSRTTIRIDGGPSASPPFHSRPLSDPAGPGSFYRLVEGLPGCMSQSHDPDTVGISAHVMTSLLSGSYQWKIPGPGEGGLPSSVGEPRAPRAVSDLSGRAVYELDGGYIGILGRPSFDGDAAMWRYPIVRPTAGRRDGAGPVAADPPPRAP